MVKAVESHRRMLFQYVDSCLAQRKVYEWVEMFRNGRKSKVDKVSMQTTDWVGPILEHYQARGETVNSEHYCALLTDGLKPVIRMTWTIVANRKFAARRCPSAYG
jgi:hypothetical protein